MDEEGQMMWTSLDEHMQKGERLHQKRVLADVTHNRETTLPPGKTLWVV